MHRKVSDVPTRIYKYGLPFGPSTNAELVSEHLYRAHKFYNTLIAIERDRIRAYRALISSDTSVAALETKLGVLETEISEVHVRRAKANSDARKKHSSEDLDSALEQLKTKRTALSKKLRSARSAAVKRQTKQLERLGEETTRLYREARAVSGLHDGTYNPVSAAARQAGRSAQIQASEPEFRSLMDGLRRHAYLGQQIKSGAARLFASKSRGGSCVFADSDTRVQLTVPNTKNHCVLKLRFASGPNREPIWAEFPMVMHRPLPEDAEIKQVRVIRKRVGPYRGERYTQWQWDAAFFVESRSFTDSRKRTGHTAAVDLGWAFADAGALRLGYLVGTDGASVPLTLPSTLVERMRIPSSLAATRKLEFNAFQATLAAWLKTNRAHALNKLLAYVRRDGTKLSAVARVVAMKSPQSMSSLVWDWRNVRTSGDEEIFAIADRWRRQNDHLHQWEANARKKAVACKAELYRVLARRLASRYDYVVFEDLDLTKNARSMVAGTNRVLVGPSRFRDEMERICGRHRVDPGGTSRLCSECGGRCVWDMRTYKTPTCESCGTVWDRDMNAAINILVASGATMKKVRRPLDLEEMRGLPAPKALTRPVQLSEPEAEFEDRSQAAE